MFLSTPYMKNPYLKGQFVEVKEIHQKCCLREDRATETREEGFFFFAASVCADHVLPVETDVLFPARLSWRRAQFPRARAQEPHAVSDSRLHWFVPIFFFLPFFLPPLCASPAKEFQLTVFPKFRSDRSRFRNREHGVSHSVLRQVQHPLLHHAAVQARVDQSDPSRIPS